MVRRTFVAATTAAALPARACGWVTFTPQEAAIVEALSEAIIPADQDPGAKETQGVRYIDRQLAGPLKRFARRYREWLAKLDDAANELSAAGFRVVLLERGRQQRFSETGHDELRSQRTTVLGNAFGPDDDRHVRLVKLGEETEFREVLPSEGSYGNVAACVGGGTFSFGAMAWRFLEKDFRMRSTYGAPEGSTLEDWPIAYQDLAPKAGANVHEALRQKGYPMPPLPYSKEGSLLYQAAKRLGWRPFPIPMAINSVALGAQFAMAGFQRLGNHYDGGRVLGVHLARKADAVRAADASRPALASATESARLLRNLQGHAYSGAYGLFREEVFDGLGPAACVALCDFNHGNAGLRGGSMLANEFIRRRRPAGVSANGRQSNQRRPAPGVHVTNGGFNPALTILAIGYWASDHIIKQWRRA